MQATVRAALWAIARTRKKGLEAGRSFQRVPGRLIPDARSVGSQPVQRRQWPCGDGSQALFKLRPVLAHMSTVPGGRLDECEVVQGLRDEVRRLKAATVVRSACDF